MTTVTLMGAVMEIRRKVHINALLLMEKAITLNRIHLARLVRVVCKVIFSSLVYDSDQAVLNFCVCVCVKIKAAKGNDRSGVELPNAKRQKLVAFMGSTPSNTSGDALASSSKQAILLRSKQVMAYPKRQSFHFLVF